MDADAVGLPDEGTGLLHPDIPKLSPIVKTEIREILWPIKYSRDRLLTSDCKEKLDQSQPVRIHIL